MRDHLITLNFEYLMNVANRGRAELLRGSTQACIREVEASALRSAWQVSDLPLGINRYEIVLYDGGCWWPVFYDGERLSQEAFLDLLATDNNDIVRSLGAPSCYAGRVTLEEWLRAQPRSVKKYDISHHDHCIAMLSKGASWTLFSGGYVYFNAGVPGLYYQKRNNLIEVGPSMIRVGDMGNHGRGVCKVPGPSLGERKDAAWSGLAVGLEEWRPDIFRPLNIHTVPIFAQRIEEIDAPRLRGEIAAFCEFQLYNRLMLVACEPSWSDAWKIRESRRWYEDLKEDLALAHDCRSTVRCFAEIHEECNLEKYQSEIQAARAIRVRLSALDLISELCELDACSIEKSASR